uniref:Remorin C-terminal domain-containing protein n=1 Tax=Salix viminalis TaxID=40686 RepID=A0A6N2MJU4_SALVM
MYRWMKGLRSQGGLRNTEPATIEKVQKLLMTGERKLLILCHQVGMFQRLERAFQKEAKITAWENLQKAKAEAAIRKLEMKLEKKRSSSMDRIMDKLRSAQKRAQEMRSSVLANQSHQVSTNSRKAISLCRTRQKGSLSGCFTCHAFYLHSSFRVTKGPPSFSFQGALQL